MCWMLSTALGDNHSDMLFVTVIVTVTFSYYSLFSACRNTYRVFTPSDRRPANFQQVHSKYTWIAGCSLDVCWKFARSLLDRVNTPLHVGAGDVVNPSRWHSGRRVWANDSYSAGSTAMELHQASWKGNPGSIYSAQIFHIRDCYFYHSLLSTWLNWFDELSTIVQFRNWL